mgnify:CR=1 FL=1
MLHVVRAAAVSVTVRNPWSAALTAFEAMLPTLLAAIAKALEGLPPRKWESHAAEPSDSNIEVTR